MAPMSGAVNVTLNGAVSRAVSETVNRPVREAVNGTVNGAVCGAVSALAQLSKFQFTRTYLLGTHIHTPSAPRYIFPRAPKLEAFLSVLEG